MRAFWCLTCIAGTAAPSLTGQEPNSDLFHLEFHRIHDGIYVANRPDPLRPVEGNATIIVNDRDVVVVDGSGAPVAAQQVVDRIEGLTDKPVRYLVNTHGHGDHTLGNQVYARVWPDVEIIAHPGTRAYMVGDGLDYVRRLVENVAERQAQAYSDIDTLAARLARDQAPYRDVLIRYLRQFWGPDMGERARQFATVEITPPTMTVNDALVLHRGDREIRVLHLGHGDTASDLVVFLPDRGDGGHGGRSDPLRLLEPSAGVDRDPRPSPRAGVRHRGARARRTTS